MKKQLIISAFSIALVGVVPAGMALARHGADDAPNSVRQEDRAQDQPTTDDTVTQTSDDSAGNLSRDDDTVNTQTGSVMVETDDNASSAEASVSLEDATVLANDTLPGRTLKKVELETEHGVLVWSFRFTDGSRVDVDATNASIVEVRDEQSKTSDDHKEDDSSDDDNRHGRD